jgi:hypothetical protein
MKYTVIIILFLLLGCQQNKEYYTVNVSNKKNSTNHWSVSGKYATRVLPGNQYPLTLHNIALQANSCYRVGVFQQKLDPNLKLAVSGNDFYVENFWVVQQTENYTEAGFLFCMPAMPIKNINVFVNNFSQNENIVDSLYIQKITANNEEILLKPFISKTLYEFLHHISIQYFEEVSIQNINKYINLTSDDFFYHHGIPKKQFQALINKKIEINPLLFDSLKKEVSKTVLPGVRFKNQNDFNPIDFEAYSETFFYFENENITFNLKGNIKNLVLSIQKLGENYQKIKIKTVANLNQKFAINANSLSYGFYQFSFYNATDTINTPIVIAPKKQSDVIVLAPVTTWHAYNTFSGKSFYLNFLDSMDVNYTSTYQPINAVHFDSVYLGHDLFILKNIFDWFNEKYSTTIYPDYFLESNPELFNGAKAIILAQHCEYFSPNMYKNLVEISQKSNLLSLGGNQIYWKVMWHNNFTKLEVRKGGGFFENTNFTGGLWRNQFTSEASLLGVAYTDDGYSTYSPYKVIDSKHWIFNDCNVEIGSIFGTSGIDNRGISGDEMDKIIQGANKNVKLLAKGENPNNGGGEMVIIERDGRATFSCGSIACGSGLGKDKVFTKMIENFMLKYMDQKPL